MRRDNAPIVSELIGKSLETLLIERDPIAAVEYVKKVISDLLCDRIDISKLIITKELSKEKYASKQPHAELALKMAKRDPGSAPKLGDRVSFVICAGNKKDLASTRAEDPMVVLENSIPIDTEYYLKNQISKPVLRIFEAILGGEENAKKLLLQGDHMKSKHINISKTGPMAKFIIIRPGCLKCNVVLTNKNTATKALCTHCVIDEKNIFEEEHNKMNVNQKKCDKIWDECRACQGSVDQATICSNRDCEFFFARQKIKYDVKINRERLNRFGDLSW